uniref:Eukaryotic translation initiation factor 4C n=1 Tax=Salix viminalis TaxID=40686 RepID=A0A6N2N0V8_SALVM
MGQINVFTLSSGQLNGPDQRGSRWASEHKLPPNQYINKDPLIVSSLSLSQLLRSSSPWHHRGETETMPKNKGKGGKNRKRGKNEADDEKRELIFKEDGQEYAQVLRMLGNGRCEAMCIDGTKRLCHIRGKMHKKVWIAAGDIILVGLRDYQDDKADVILKYMPDEARLLKAYGELPENTRLNEGIAGGLDEEDDGAGDDYIEFEDEDIDKI